MITVWMRLAMALSLLLLVACEDETNDTTVVNSKEHADPVEILVATDLMPHLQMGPSLMITRQNFGQGF